MRPWNSMRRGFGCGRRNPPPRFARGRSYNHHPFQLRHLIDSRVNVDISPYRRIAMSRFINWSTVLSQEGPGLSSSAKQLLKTSSNGEEHGESLWGWQSPSKLYTFNLNKPWNKLIMSWKMPQFFRHFRPLIFGIFGKNGTGLMWA